MLEVGQHELACGAVVQLDRDSCFWLDQLGVDEPARPQVHAVLLFALSPERSADVSDSHHLGDPRAPALFELRPKGRLAAAGLTCHEHSLDARPREIYIALRSPLDEVSGIRGCEHRGLRPKQLDRSNQALGVSRPDWNVAEADTVERGKRRTGHERAGVVGRDDALAGGDARSRVAARRAGHPVLEIARRQRDVGGRPGGAARRVDPHDLGRRRAEMRADRIVGGARRRKLALLRERQPHDVCEPARRPGRGESRFAQLLAIEGRAVEEVGELRPI